VARHEPSDAARTSAPSRQLCCFAVGAQEYALDIMRIKEIVNPLPITVVPGAPAFVEGIVELRGAFLPVIDLRTRFGLAVTAADRDSKYVIARVDGRQVGLVVDRVIEVRRVELAQVAPPPPLAVATGARPFFSGVVKWDERIVLIVDLDQVLTEDERRDLAALQAQASRSEA
jgi:purine-binding chemotaxis protein CheW